MTLVDMDSITFYQPAAATTPSKRANLQRNMWDDVLEDSDEDLPSVQEILSTPQPRGMVGDLSTTAESKWRESCSSPGRAIVTEEVEVVHCSDKSSAENSTPRKVPNSGLGSQRDSVAERNGFNIEKPVEPPTSICDNDDRPLYGGPEDSEEFIKSKDKDNEVDECDSEYQDQDEEDTEEGENEEAIEDEDDDPRSRERPRQNCEDFEGSRDHSRGKTSSKIWISHERRPISTSSSTGPGRMKEGEADYQEWPMEGFLKRTRVGHKLFYSLDFRLSDPGTTVSTTGPSRSSRKRSKVQDRNGRNSPVVLIPSEPSPTESPSRKARSRFTPREDEKLIHLKEVKTLSWQEISGHFPERDMRTLQVHYCTKLKRRRAPRRDVS